MNRERYEVKSKESFKRLLLIFFNDHIITMLTKTRMKIYFLVGCLYYIIIINFASAGLITVSYTSPTTSTFIAPYWVNSINVVAVGASGGSSTSATTTGNGGYGAIVTATIQVTPSATYYVWVGVVEAVELKVPFSSQGVRMVGAVAVPMREAEVVVLLICALLEIHWRIEY